jgi:hypothetical protein
MLDHILTVDKLLLRHWENEYFCPLCRQNLETASHLFTECTYSLKVWSSIAARFNQDGINPEKWLKEQHNVQSWYRNMVGDQPKVRRKIIFPLANLVCWELWMERNRRIFTNKICQYMR